MANYSGLVADLVLRTSELGAKNIVGCLEISIKWRLHHQRLQL